MFVRTKKRGTRTYLQIVENHRIEGKIQQRVLGTLGRLDVLQETGGLDALMVSMQRFSEKLAIIGAHDRHAAVLHVGLPLRQKGRHLCDQAGAVGAEGGEYQVLLVAHVLPNPYQSQNATVAARPRV